MPTALRGHGTQECLTQVLAHASQFSYLLSTRLVISKMSLRREHESLLCLRGGLKRFRLAEFAKC
jgi:hypothetical protein